MAFLRRPYRRLRSISCASPAAAQVPRAAWVQTSCLDYQCLSGLDRAQSHGACCNQGRPQEPALSVRLPRMLQRVRAPPPAAHCGTARVPAWHGVGACVNQTEQSVLGRWDDHS